MSIGQFGVKLMCDYFDESELTNPGVNVTGIAVKGSNKSMLKLDENRMAKIKRLCVGKDDGTDPVKKTNWSIVKNAMSKKMSEMKKKGVQLTAT